MLLEDIEGKWKCLSVNAQCDECGAKYKAKISTALRQEKIVGHHQCKKCSSRRAGKKTAAKMSEIYSLLYSGDGNFAKKHGVGEKISKALKGKKLSEEHKQKLRKSKTATEKFLKAMKDPELRKKRSERMKLDNPSFKPEVREKISNTVTQQYLNGEIKSVYHKMKTGWFDGIKTNKPIWYRSGLEMDFLTLIDRCEWIKLVESAEYIRIRYQYNGIEHSYLPDFKITFDNDSAIIVEIKSTYFETKPNWKHKLEALKSFCELMGFEYLVLTEKENNKWLERLNECKQHKVKERGI